MDNCILPTKAIEYLELINHSKEIKDAFEKAIKSIDSCRTYQFDYHQLFQEGLRKLINDSICDLSSRFNISSEAIVFYFRLDRDIYHKISDEASFYNVSGIDCSGFDSKYKFRFSSFHGGRYQEIYTKGYEDIISYLHSNCDLFPNSARTYIKAKIRKYKSNPAIKTLNNFFKAKSWATTLPDDFKITYFKNVLSFLNKNNTHLDALISHSYVYTVVKEKYPDNITAMNFCHQLSTKLSVNIESFFSDSSFSDQVLYWNSISKMLQECHGLREIIMNYNIGHRGHFCLLLETITDDADNKNLLLSEQDRLFCKLFNTDYFKLEDCPAKQKEELILSYKRQYFTKFGI